VELSRIRKLRGRYCMENRYLFRGKRLDNNEWIIGNLSKDRLQDKRNNYYINNERSEFIECYDDIDGLIDQDHHIEWDCDIDIKEGDTVIFDYLMAIKNLGFMLQDIKNQYDDWGRWVIIDKKLHIFMNYDNLYLRIRDGEFTTLNGYVIIKPEKEETNFIIKDEFNLRRGECKFTGKPNKSYFDDGKHTLMPSEGDNIIFMDHANIKLTPKYYKLFSEELWLTPGYRIIGNF
jgi:hypothetical protein